MADDRLLTEPEYQDFLKQCDALEDQAHWENLTAILTASFQHIEEQNVRIQILEEVIRAQASKSAELKKILTSFEKELIELRCLTKTK